ncbi:hypothetical protein P7C71_g1824, partial [Lecanoromycetidae sp. Uapishka_2]
METIEPGAPDSGLASELIRACSNGDVPTLQRHAQALSKLESKISSTPPASQAPLLKEMLLAAIRDRRSEVVSYLLGEYPKIPIRQDSILLAGLETRSIPILTILLKHEPKIINHELEGMATLLTTSLSSSDPTIPDFLLDSGADPNSGIVAHMSPLFYAIGARQPLSVIKKMVDKGADVSKDRLAVFEAVRVGRADALQVFLDAGASLHNGGELLHLAVRNGNIDVVKLLVKTNAHLVETRDEQGKTASEIASNKGLGEIVDLLESQKGRSIWQYLKKWRF